MLAKEKSRVGNPSVASKEPSANQARREGTERVCRDLPPSCRSKVHSYVCESRDVTGAVLKIIYTKGKSLHGINDVGDEKDS